MSDAKMPDFFGFLCADGYAEELNVINTRDGFFLLCTSLSDLLLKRNIAYLTSPDGEKLICENFFDDWYLYAVPDGGDYVYSLLKMREQEHDAENGAFADGDTPGVTVSFVAFDCDILSRCLDEPTEENRKKLNHEIHRVVLYRKQRHHEALKKYFKDPRSQGSYLVADTYAKYIASFAENGYIAVPDYYRKLISSENRDEMSKNAARLFDFIKSLNYGVGNVVCDNEKIYIKDRENPTKYEAAAILATHTGNTSVYSFAAEVEYHAKFLIPLAKIRIPFCGKSVYDSAIRADMTVDDAECQGTAPFYRIDSKIVKRQYILHRDEEDEKGGTI